jgi:hypothetical protein
MNNYVVYAHKTTDTDELFYIGEGRPDRPFSIQNRNRYWHFKVSKHGGNFRVELLAENLSKIEAESMEKQLISEALAAGLPLVNFCVGTLFGSHWLSKAPKEAHPMYGRKRTMPEVAEANRRRKGDKGKPRPDLSERNRLMGSQYKHYKRRVRCIERGEVFESVKAAGDSVNRSDSNVHRSIQTGMRAGGYHWEYVNPGRKPQP